MFECLFEIHFSCYNCNYFVMRSGGPSHPAVINTLYITSLYLHQSQGIKYSNSHLVFLKSKIVTQLQLKHLRQLPQQRDGDGRNYC